MRRKMSFCAGIEFEKKKSNSQGLPSKRAVQGRRNFSFGVHGAIAVC
jgi:hypothetical protein